MDGSHPPFRNIRGGMRKSFNFYLGFSFWSAYNDHFWSWAAIYFKPLALTLQSRTVQSKGCSVASRMCFTHTQLQQHGPRNYPLYSSLRLRAQPREDTGLSPAKAVFGAPLSKIFLKPCMFLPLLCLGTILSPTCPASCQPSCSLPPHLGLSGQPGSTPSATLRRPLRGSALRPPLLHHPSRFEGRRSQPP